ncbi:TetR family transcriptional regulator [Emticicia sp. CRIBPO]|uniref:TetR/AcrR family transcriptional regulator n=1 Tax=Emticicia sp. CRIBPO TaxID=2683258 RepID=UPI001412FB1F|nr:TetR/AcrR family transcriptional regulator [Emticicia sp. CRIBPO]NBA88439.1 TetR family transcriptional regulator [Emticicia sp. CRIBPO]
MSQNRIRREEDIEHFKKTVLDTAILLMREENDWGMVSVNKIASLMRYTPPNIYHYFKSKDDILFQLGSRGSAILVSKFTAVAESNSFAPREKLRQIGVAYWDFSVEHGELYDLMFHVRQKKLDKERIFTNIATIQNIVKEVNPAITTDEEAYKVYNGLHCLLHGFISIKKNNRIPIDDQDYFKELFDEALQKFVDQV